MPGMEMFVILALAMGAMWLMTSRSRKQQRQAQDFRSNLEVGQRVMTGSGFFGTVVAVDGDDITLESAPGITTVWLRAAISRLAPLPVDEPEADEPTPGLLEQRDPELPEDPERP